MTRETLLARTVVELADRMVDEFDIVDLLTTLADRCVEVLDVTAAGIMLASPGGKLTLMTSSSAAMEAVEQYELQAQEGPCVECYRSGRPVVEGDLTRTPARWPNFTPVAVAAGFRAVDAVPMRLRRDIIGAVNLFRDQPRSLSDDDVVAAQTMADVATIAILQHHAAAGIRLVHHQLQQALDSRIVIEQAKGMIAEHEGVDVERAFARLRRHARNHNQRLADVADAIVSGTLTVDTLDSV